MLDELDDLIVGMLEQACDCSDRGQFDDSEAYVDQAGLLKKLKANYEIYREAAMYLATYVAATRQTSSKGRQETSHEWGPIADKVNEALKADV